MARAIIHHPQSRANLLRETLRWDPAIRRIGVRFQEVEGSEDGLRMVVRSRGRILRLRRGPEWRGVPLERLKQSLKGELSALNGTGAGSGPAVGGRRNWRSHGGGGGAGLEACGAPGSGVRVGTMVERLPVRGQAPVLARPRAPPAS